MNITDSIPENLATKKPAQVLASFFDNYTIDEVRLILLQTLQGYALNEQKGFLPLNSTDEEITEVFDSLIDLLAAVNTLRVEGRFGTVV